MLQIKTIKEKDPYVFDSYVNEALRDGWTLARRLTGPNDFVAELEKEIVTEAERCCENCRYFSLHCDLEPCVSCSDDCDKWEAAEE